MNAPARNQQSNQPAKQQSNKMRVASFLQSDQGLELVNNYAPEEIDQDKLRQTAIYVLNNGPDKLEKCEVPSILEAVLQSFHDGIDLTRGEGHLVPYPPDVDYRIDYKGLVRLAEEDSEVHVDADVVREGEEFKKWRDDSGLHFRHESSPFGGGEPIGAYCVVYESGRPKKVEAMGVDELEDIAEQSGNPYNDKWSDPWKDYFWEMAKKSVTRRALKTVDTRPAVDRAIVRENQKRFQQQDDAADVETLETNASSQGGGVIASQAQSKPKALETAGEAAGEASSANEGNNSTDSQSNGQAELVGEKDGSQAPSGRNQQSGMPDNNQVDQPGQKSLSSLRRGVSQMATHAEGVGDSDVDEFKDALEREDIWEDRAELAEVREDLKGADSRWSEVMYPLIQQAGSGNSDEGDGNANAASSTDNGNDQARSGPNGSADYPPSGPTEAIEWLADKSKAADKVVERLRKHCDSDDDVYRVLLHIAEQLGVDPDAPIDGLAGADLSGFRQQCMSSPRKITGLVNEAIDEIPY